MFDAIRTRINATTVVAVLALVFAMTGGAYAAKKYLITSTKQISPSVLKSLQGKAGAAGANGAQGAAGPAGPVGPQGAAGAAGAKGEKGDAGSAGAPGKSVAVAPIVAGSPGECEETGGVLVKPEGGAGVGVCNGEEGQRGPQGIQGIPGPTCSNTGACLLPVGATETGVWSFRTNNGVGRPYVNISFPLRITEEPEFHYVTIAQQIAGSAVAEGCPSTGPVGFVKPEAKSGQLCMYEGNTLLNSNPPEVAGGFDPTSGFILEFEVKKPAEEAGGTGTWAVAR